MKKGFKVTDVNRQKKIGIAADSLKEVIEKSRKKLAVNVGTAECRIYVAEDGTAVEDDEYLATLPSQTLLVLLKDKENMVTEFNYLYNLIRSTKIDFLSAGNKAEDFLMTNIKDKFRVFQKYIQTASEDRTMASERTQDPAWFRGLEPSEVSKEQSMSKRVKDRMRGYYYKTKTGLQNSPIYIHSKNGLGKILIDTLLLDLRKILECNKYNSSYFNRKATKNRLCSESGLFECGGLWNIEKCAYEGEHVINPYRSREERIIFQTWNLDHRVELSRSIIPKILEAVEVISKGAAICILCDKKVKEGAIDPNKYYSQIFTTNNLKLVHIVCHYKGKHLFYSDVYTMCNKCFKSSKTLGEEGVVDKYAL